MRRNLFYILIFSSLLLSCAKPEKHYEIRSVEFMRDDGWSEGISLSIDSTLTYRYFDASKKRSYIGLVDENFWDTLNRKLEAIKFRTILLPKDINCQDCDEFSLLIHWKNHERKIVMYGVDSSNALSNALIWVDSSYRRIKLKQVDTSFNFEMKHSVSPDFGIEHVKFPPPLPKPKTKKKDIIDLY